MALSAKPRTLLQEWECRNGFRASGKLIQLSTKRVSGTGLRMMSLLNASCASEESCGGFNWYEKEKLLRLQYQAGGWWWCVVVATRRVASTCRGDACIGSLQPAVRSRTTGATATFVGWLLCIRAAVKSRGKRSLLQVAPPTDEQAGPQTLPGAGPQPKSRYPCPRIRPQRRPRQEAR